eukprot:12263544-Heterocapsa_arctica.AAC.1
MPGCPACSDVPHGAHSAACVKRRRNFELKQSLKKAKLMEDQEEYDEKDMAEAEKVYEDEDEEMQKRRRKRACEAEADERPKLR